MDYQELIHTPLIPARIAALARKAAHTLVPVLIKGETGTGKDIIARIIHYSSDGRYHRFSRVDCRLLAEGAFVSHLEQFLKDIQFGSVSSTLYFKEVGSLGQRCQAKLLELVENGSFQGCDEKKAVGNLRFVASTSEDLKGKVAQGKFMEDLYHRLNTISISMPPLRDRANDITAIAQYILGEYARKMKVEKVEISNPAMNVLKSYWWPGNLKELEHVVIRSAILSEGRQLLEKDLLFESQNGNSSFTSLSGRAEAGLLTPNERTGKEDQDGESLAALLIELVHRIKNPLVSIKTFTQLLREKFNDPEFKDYFYKVVTEDIEKIDSVLNGILNYVKVNTPLEKTDTVHALLDEVLKRHAGHFEEKRIRIFKRYEKELPETIVHEEQLRYILNSLLQFAVPAIPLDGSIGFLTKSLGGKSGERRSVEIMVIFTGCKRPPGQLDQMLGFAPSHQEKAIELELRLMQEIVQKNRGSVRFEVNEKKPRTLISIRFPAERRKTFYYPPSNNL